MKKGIGRRAVLRGGAAAALAGGLATTKPVQSSVSLLPRFLQELPRPGVVAGNLTLPAAEGWHRFHPWLPLTRTWGYGGVAYGGPVVEAMAGTPQTLRFANALGAHLLADNISTAVHGARATDANAPRTTVHMHGAVVAASSDGHPEDVFFPGQTKAYNYTHRQEACHLWFHDHSLGLTRLNVYAGLASNLLLRDAYDLGVGNTLGLPSGDCEVPLTLQDKAVDVFSGKYQYMPALLGKNSWFPGIFGDLSLVNGAAFPKMTVDRGVYRFRILNAANSRPYSLAMSNGTKFHVIGNDQGMLNAPVPTASLDMLPGERYDVLVDFSNTPAGSTIVVYNTAIPPNGGFIFGSFAEVMRFDVRATLGRFRTLPTRLRGGAGQRAALPSASSIVPVRQRTVTLAQVLDIACGATAVPLQLRLNNMRFEQEADTMAAGQWELWNVVNTTTESHPFHVHLAEMRILNRQKMNMAAYLLAHPIPPVATHWAPPADGFASGAATAPAAWEAGRKDTVNATAGAVTRILVRLPTTEEAGFDPRASFTNLEGQRLSGYMYHCHLLEHEDCDMMRPMLVV